ncbi:MAG: GNAT family N-acetyltransferase [Candidatus Dormibacteria bacterium]
MTRSTDIAIRDATPSDAEAIAALHLASWLAAYRGIVPDECLNTVTIQSRVTRWRRALSAAESPLIETVVAVDRATILGVCSSGLRRQPASSDVGEVYALHVRPDCRRHGFGKLLLDGAVRRLATRGLTGAVLWVLRENASARRFYEAQGWSFTGEERTDDREGYDIPEARYAITFERQATQPGQAILVL